jgi:hypothetical protein
MKIIKNPFVETDFGPDSEDPLLLLGEICHQIPDFDLSVKSEKHRRGKRWG